MTYADTGGRRRQRGHSGGGNVTLNKTGTATGTVAVTGSGTSTRTVTISDITGDGSLGISIASGTATDIAGNSTGAAGPSTTFTVDNIAPSLSISAPSVTVTGTASVTYALTYADGDGSGINTITLEAGNITLNKTGTANATVAVAGSGTAARTVTNSGITGDGTLGISIVAGTATDLSGNPAPAVGPSATFAVDTTAPTVSISAPSSPLTPQGPVSYSVAYADANFSGSTLTAGKVTLNKTGTANGTVSVTGTGTSRTVTLSSITGNGTLGISLSAGTGTDVAGNLAPAVGPSAAFTVDNSAPVVAISAPSGAFANTGPVSYSVIYADDNFSSSTLTAAKVILNRNGTTEP